MTDGQPMLEPSGAPMKGPQLLVAIFHESVHVARGIQGVLGQAGHHASVIDLDASTSLAEVRGQRPDVVISSVSTAPSLANSQMAPVVVVLPDATTPTLIDSLRSGAAGVFHLLQSESEVVRVIECAADSLALIPSSMMREVLADIPAALDSTPDLSAVQQRVLMSIARGKRIAETAEEISYSTREVSRVIASLLELFGVDTREELLVMASKQRIV